MAEEDEREAVLDVLDGRRQAKPADQIVEETDLDEETVNDVLSELVDDDAIAHDMDVRYYVPSDDL